MDQDELEVHKNTKRFRFVIRIHESHIFVLRKTHFKQMKIIAVYTQLKQLRNKAWKKKKKKKIQAWTGIEPVTSAIPVQRSNQCI